MTDEYSTDRAVAAARDADWEKHHGGEPRPLEVGAKELWGGGYEFLIPADEEREKEIIKLLTDAVRITGDNRRSAKTRPDNIEGVVAYTASAYMRLGRAIALMAMENGLSVDSPNYGKLVCEE